jgi:hypothetical protein
MVSSGMLRRVALVRTDVSEERSASFIGVTRIGELGTTLAVTSNRRTLRSIHRLLVTASSSLRLFVTGRARNWPLCEHVTAEVRSTTKK